LAFLRAFVDDSVAQKGDKRLFYAGYLHRADAWAEFSDIWDRELRREPTIDYFKGSGDQFAGWGARAREAKIARLAQIIDAFQPQSFHFSLNRKLFEEIAKPVSPYGLARPHFQACFMVIAGLTRYAASKGISTPIEFIFDQQDGVDRDVDLFFSHMIKQLPEEARRLIAHAPWFKSDLDKQFMPLQAADMLAWHIRRRHEYPEKPLPVYNSLLNRDGHLGGEFPDDLTKKLADHHSSIEGTSLIRSPAQWAKLTREIERLQAAGIDPSKISGPGIYYPEGTPFLVKLIDKIRRSFHRA
jgi:hypothetical protein